MRTVGLDLSLTSAGVATIETNTTQETAWADVVRSKPPADTEKATYEQRGDRLEDIAVRLLAWCVQPDPHMVVLEGPAYSRSQGSAHDRSGLWWLMYHQLRRRHIPVAVVPPNVRAIYATGKALDKDQVLAAVVRRYPDVPITNNNEADALILAAMGARKLGHPIEASLPQTHLRAIDGAQWPHLVSA